MEPVLIVVDMQNDFLDPQGALYCGDEARGIIPRVRELAQAHLDQGHAVFFTQDTHAEGDKEFEVFPRHCVQGEWGQRLIPELEAFSGHPNVHVIQKSRYSGFFRTDLEGRLAELRPSAVEVCGVCTSICVMDTVGELRNRDYAVRVHRDAVADPDPQMHAFSLKRMEKIYAAQVVG